MWSSSIEDFNPDVILKKATGTGKQDANEDSKEKNK